MALPEVDCTEEIHDDDVASFLFLVSSPLPLSLSRATASINFRRMLPDKIVIFLDAWLCRSSLCAKEEKLSPSVGRMWSEKNDISMKSNYCIIQHLLFSSMISQWNQFAAHKFHLLLHNL